MKSATIRIDGMRCEGCVRTVKALIGAEPGVRAAEVSLADRQARVLYDPEAVSEAQLVKAIERGGFRVPSA